MIAIWRRLAHLFRPEKLEADIREELEFHRSQTTGHFGNATRTQEETREASTIIWLETLRQDIRVTFRLLSRTPTSSALASFTAVGLLASGKTRDEG